MPEISAALRPSGSVRTQPDPSLLHLLWPKWLTARARSLADERGRGARFAILGFFGLLFWSFIFGVLYRLLAYFRGVQEIGPLLAGKLLALILVGFFSILLLSNIITALSSFFLAKDLDMLVAGPVDWLKLYGAKLLETILHSSWMVALMSVPMFAAYGVVYDGGWWFPLIVLADDSEFVARELNNFLWVVFTRSNPAADVHGIGAGLRQKHFGCEGSLIIDARSKPHHAPPLLEDPDVSKRIDAIAARGGPLARYL